MLLSVARTPGQCVADEKQLHVVIWEGWQPERSGWLEEERDLEKVATCGPHGPGAIVCRRQEPL